MLTGQLIKYTNTRRLDKSAAVVSERIEDIVIWRLNRPELRNAISDSEVVDELVNLADKAQADRSVRVVILSGNGSAFSSGGNVKNIQTDLTESTMTPAEIEEWYAKGIQRIPSAFYRLDVGSIRGY